jgi:hypothetical protein
MEMVVAAAAAAVAVDAEAVDAEAARARGARHTHCWYSFTESHDTSARSFEVNASPPFRDLSTMKLPPAFHDRFVSTSYIGRGGLIFGRIWNNTGTSTVEVTQTHIQIHSQCL